MTWTPERTAELRRLKSEGLSMSQIARRLGITRNAVSGKMNRIGIMGNLPRNYHIGRKYKRVENPTRVSGNWDQRTFAPYHIWKAEKKRERERELDGR